MPDQRSGRHEHTAAPHRFECPEGYGVGCRNPLCRAQYAMQAREDSQRRRKGKPVAFQSWM